MYDSSHYQQTSHNQILHIQDQKQYIGEMCGGWACASYSLACNNPPLSTLRYTGREFIPTPCGPHDKCFAKDTSRSRGNTNRPINVTVAMNPCLEISKAVCKEEPNDSNQAVDNWKKAYEKAKCSPSEGSKHKNISPI